MSEPIHESGETGVHPFGTWWAFGVWCVGGAASMLACAYLIGERMVSLYLGFVLVHVGILLMIGAIFVVDAILKTVRGVRGGIEGQR